MRMFWNTLASFAVFVASLVTADAQVTLRVVPHSDLKIVDPIWSPVYITRNARRFTRSDARRARNLIGNRVIADIQKELAVETGEAPARFFESDGGFPHG